MQWFLIGISGVTCGGKTTLAHSLRGYLLKEQNKPIGKSSYILGEVKLISQDDYFLPVGDIRHQWIPELNAINFEVLSSMDMRRLLNDINWFLQQTIVPWDKQQYNKKNHMCNNNNTKKCRNNINKQQQYQIHKQRQQLSTISTKPTDNLSIVKNDTKILNILIVEGFIIFNQPEILHLSNLKFHFHLPYEKCFERRSKRHYDPPDVTGYFEMCVWPHYEKNLSRYRDRKDIIFLNGETESERIFMFVLEKFFTYIEQGTSTNNINDKASSSVLSMNLRMQHHQQQMHDEAIQSSKQHQTLSLAQQ